MIKMKSIIQSVVWNFTRSKRGISKKLSAFAEFYLDNYYDSYGSFDINGERFLLQSLKSIDFNTIFDVGANVGNWSLIAAEYFPKATIHAFELSSSTYSTTTSRLSGSKFVTNNVGLSNVAGVVRYKDYGDKSGKNTIISDASFWDETIPLESKESILTTGDIYCDEHKISFIDFLKIDVEGADHLVLQGFERMLTNKKIRVIQFEYGYTHADAKFLMRDFFSLLNSKGYIVGKLWSDGVEFSDFFYWLNNFKSGPNYVAVRQDDVEVINTISTKRQSVFYGLDKPVFKTMRQ
jgi:FkbM family methyltransferase